MFLQTTTTSLLQRFKSVTTCSSSKGIVKQMKKWGKLKEYPFRQIQAYSRIFCCIQAYSDISRYNQACSDIFTHSGMFTHSGIIQEYSKPCVILAYSELCYIQNPGIFKTRDISRTLTYPKVWHIQNRRYIQNPGLFRTLRYSEREVCSEPCQTSAIERFEKQLTAIFSFASYNHFRNISFPCPLVHEIHMIFLMQV